MVDLAEVTRTFDASGEGVVSVMALTWKVDALKDAPATAWETLASHPDLFTYLPTAYGFQYWVRNGARKDPRRIVRALAKAPEGLPLARLAGRVQIRGEEIVEVLKYLSDAVRWAPATGAPDEPGEQVWSLTLSVDQVLARLETPPANPYATPTSTPSVRPAQPRALSAAEVRQAMVDQVPGYRDRVAALQSATFTREANRQMADEARQAMAALDQRFSPDRFRAVGSLVRRLERELVREQQSAPVVKSPPQPHGLKEHRRVGTGRPVPREYTPFHKP